MPASRIATLPAGFNSRFLEGLAPRTLAIVRSAAVERRFLANSIVTNQGDAAERLFLLTSGRARYFFMSPEGRKVLLLWLTPGEVIGGAAFLPRPCEYLLSSETVKDSTLLEWDRATIRRLAAEHPRLLENLLLVTFDYAGWYLADHVALIERSAAERLAQVLVRLAGVIGHKVPDGVEFDVTNEELASAANITPFTASRLLSEWQHDRAIAKRRGKILLRAPERLLLRVV
jgi:CRP-like cAMP-binding protein